VTNLKRGDFSPALYRCAEVKSWLEDMVAAQDAAAALTPLLPPEPVEPIIDDRAARKAKAQVRIRQLESQAVEDEPVVPVQSVGSGWCALAEGDEPFASNVVRGSRPARYWGSL
jgi:hypothetical protein